MGSVIISLIKNKSFLIGTDTYGVVFFNNKWSVDLEGTKKINGKFKSSWGGHKTVDPPLLKNYHSLMKLQCSRAGLIVHVYTIILYSLANHCHISANLNDLIRVSF